MILIILIDQLQYGKADSVSQNAVYLFVAKLCLCQAQQYLVTLAQLQISNVYQYIQNCEEKN